MRLERELPVLVQRDRGSGSVEYIPFWPSHVYTGLRAIAHHTYMDERQDNAGLLVAWCSHRARYSFSGCQSEPRQSSYWRLRLVIIIFTKTAGAHDNRAFRRW